jgi:hypothetical protein
MVVLIGIVVGSLLLPAPRVNAGYFNCMEYPYLCWRCTPTRPWIAGSCYTIPYGAIGYCICIDGEGYACYAEEGCQAEWFDY